MYYIYRHQCFTIGALIVYIFLWNRHCQVKMIILLLKLSYITTDISLLFIFLYCHLCLNDLQFFFPEIILLFPAGSYIWRQDDHAHEIFILAHGTAKILTSDKKELVTVSASNTSFCMGEEQFFNQLRRNFEIR